MIRGSFRRGLTLGLLAAAVVAAVRAALTRREAPAAPADLPPWPPLDVAPTTEVRTGAEAEAHFADASRQQERPLSDWEPTAPLPPTEEATTLPPWVEPVDGACPASHPVKAKLASQIFHVDGGLSYARTNPDRCYLDAAAAVADGLRPAKR